MCVNKKCRDTVTGKLRRAVPLCPSCRYLARRVFGATVAICAVIYFVLTHLPIKR